MSKHGSKAARLRSRFSPTAVTVLFGVLLVVFGWCGLAYLTWLDREGEIDRIRTENSFVARAFEEHARRIFKTSDTALLFMKREFEKSGSVTDRIRDFGAMTKDDLQAVQVAVSDAEGNLIYSAVPLSAPVSVAQREHFLIHMQNRNAGLVIAKPVKAVATGTWAFFLSRRLEKRDGSFAGIVAVGIDPFYFGRIYGEKSLGQTRSGIVVGLNDHIVRTRISRTVKIVGDDIGGYSPVFREAAKAPSGEYEFVAAIDNITKLASYRVMPDYPLVVIISANKNEVLVEYRKRFAINAVGTTLFSIFVAGFCFFLIRAHRTALRGEEERQSLHGRLAQAQKMEAIGTLAGGVAHDFNNMLGVIIGRTEIALAKAGNDSPLRSDLEEINKAAMRSADVTRQLLTFARKQAIAPRIVDLNECVESSLRLIRRFIGEEIDLSWNPGRHLWKVKIDPSQLDQILTNLASNARDAISGVGKVAIETYNAVHDARFCDSHPGARLGEYVVLNVSDDGSGIDPDTLPNIFDPFFTTKELGKGTGLGLATVFGIVKQNGGFIVVGNASPRGTVVSIHLPRVEGQVEAETKGPAGSAHSRRGKETVMVVEDEEANLALVKEILESFGYRVLSAVNPLCAIDLANEFVGGIDLLVTDVVMPGMNGLELSERLSADRKGMRTIFMSGYTANILADRGVEEDGANFIQKPFTPAELAAKVREMLDAPKG